MWSMTPFIKLSLGSVCPANLLMVKPVETCLTPRIEALVFLHTQSNRKIRLLFLFIGGRSEASQLGSYRAATLSRFLFSKVGGMAVRSVDPGQLPKVELGKPDCWCTA